MTVYRHAPENHGEGIHVEGFDFCIPRKIRIDAFGMKLGAL